MICRELHASYFDSYETRQLKQRSKILKSGKRFTERKIMYCLCNICCHCKISVTKTIHFILFNALTVGHVIWGKITVRILNHSRREYFGLVQLRYRSPFSSWNVNMFHNNLMDKSYDDFEVHF